MARLLHTKNAGAATFSDEWDGIVKLKTTIAALALVAASSAGAAEFWTYVPGNGQLTNNIPGGDSSFGAVQVTGYSGSGGQFNGNFWTGASKPADSFFRFFCIEIGQFANGGPNTYFSSILSNDSIKKLYDVAYPNKTAGDFWNGAVTNFGVFADATSAAAFQVALWNLVFDGDTSLSGGSFQWTGGATAVSTAAQSLLNQVASYTGDGFSRWTLYQFVSPPPNSETQTAYQNYLSATYQVPEPGSLALLGFALAGLGVAAGRRRRG